MLPRMNACTGELESLLDAIFGFSEVSSPAAFCLVVWQRVESFGCGDVCVLVQGCSSTEEVVKIAGALTLKLISFDYLNTA